MWLDLALGQATPPAAEAPQEDPELMLHVTGTPHNAIDRGATPLLSLALPIDITSNVARDDKQFETAVPKLMVHVSSTPRDDG